MRSGTIQNNTYSHLTAKERDTISFPARIIKERQLLKGAILDFGCGLGKDVELLNSIGHNVTAYDPFYFPDYPKKLFDTIICFYVLNVLLPNEQEHVLMNVSSLLKSNGKAYFAVRRDIQYEGFRLHKLHQKQTYQCNVLLPFKSIFKNESCEIYEYQHYTALHQGNEQLSPFLKGNEERELVTESTEAFTIYDKYPVNPGHCLIIPKRITANYFDLTVAEQQACWSMVNKVQNILQEQYNPDGFNIGVNVEEAAGQTIPHVHLHVIPRYNHDMEDPRGGVRNVIPSRGNYLK
ncbi:diadenosine tetraphosphate (Ap4A) HIT family hydrolase [Pontibacter ummariensis]|uniref:Diadenosine tetraphosphate (Ap4A) hydrolase n=1 Tax=Pontibacter ummariensis TaxID=1610492 RepID=A0A239F7R2_9BACT|nr:HIT family protein [Pontibacter ummariensis]PRY12416.1 diadenosine tetraphosphate (Ap4A) HIT family hydrolase [Pontibacter ummariensis]SNS52192.1 Diadenosine tetraphosphate (Ap4A) hydrolase [Pontibacter ummariensis]